MVQESITGVLDLEDDNPNIVARMITFLYLQDYDESETSDEAGKEGYGRLLINAIVYIIADKYDISALKDLARKKHKEALLTDWNTPLFLHKSGTHIRGSTRNRYMSYGDSSSYRLQTY